MYSGKKRALMRESRSHSLAKLTFTRVHPKSVLNKGTGFLAGYTHSLNPYTGCAFACSYCYVRKMPVNLFRNEDWGTWVDIKQGAAEVFRKQFRRAKRKGPVTIFMSSSTDPYQPIEVQERITRSLLEVMAEEPPDFLLLQTRSPLVVRDIDLLAGLGEHVRVSMTIETDLEEVRKHFTPTAPPIQARLSTLQKLQAAGIPSQAAVAPVLPSSSQFAARLRPLVSRVVMDDYFMGDGSGGKRTQSLQIHKLYEQLGLEAWYDPAQIKRIWQQFQEHFAEDELFLSQRGFEP